MPRQDDDSRRHRLTTVMNADEILVVNEDGIAERGTHRELIEKGGIYADLWNGIARLPQE